MTQPYHPVVELLQQLIRIPSPNPPGDCRAIAGFCEQFLQKAGFTTMNVAPDDRAWSVVGSAGDGDGPSLVLHAHIDTVPLGQNARWSYDPFGGTIDGGRVYGLGSIDDKAPLAAMLQAAADVVASGALHGRLVVVCAAEEEVGGRLGTRWLADNGHIPECDFVIVGEQTHNRVATAHKGVLRATIGCAGRTAHATDPWRGRNAINGMARLVLDLEQYQRDVLEAHPHPLLGPASINIGVIEGGVSANVVADGCLIRVDRRMLPGEDPQAVLAELHSLVAARQAVDPERTYVVDEVLVSNWFQTAGDDPFTRRLLEICADETGAPAEPVGYLPGSDAKHLTGIARQGMVVFGPGSYRVAHSTDEYTDIAELEATYRILRRLAQACFKASRQQPAAGDGKEAV
jgi:acetylornithine deacetylase/succinyl-diaminopimelate desuccinylase-like protein